MRFGPCIELCDVLILRVKVSQNNSPLKTHKQSDAYSLSLFCDLLAQTVCTGYCRSGLPAAGVRGDDSVDVEWKRPTRINNNDAEYCPKGKPYTWKEWFQLDVKSALINSPVVKTQLRRLLIFKGKALVRSAGVQLRFLEL
ncbi:hypothetical protein EVAR_63591_1 [Eumeta japonica]|uniref:Uncharacterized protein n=1 Tax=Eumeta variegata TaxID=151549 RepID=A0A4C1ZK99_EUMVA|nr:hypothetical protein EVAR_63591_1 [Eumeta japonica]